MLLDDELRLRLERAVITPHPARAVRALVRNLFREGYNNEEIFEVFSEFVPLLRNTGQDRKADEDAVLDAMDELSHWLHPDAWEEIEEQ